LRAFARGNDVLADFVGNDDGFAFGVVAGHDTPDFQGHVGVPHKLILAFYSGRRRRAIR
jgi:hypothetical protein